MRNDQPPADAVELFWLAVRYVGGELSDAERTGFEARLAKDLAACEAVGEAMRLTAGLHAVYEESAPGAQRSETHPMKRRLFPVAVSAALVLVTGLVCTFWQSSDSARTKIASVEIASVELVNRWRLDRRFAAIESPDGDDFPDEDAEILDESLSAPGWMISAVRLTAHDDSHP